MAADFQRGDTVEICGKQDGFKGSYFEATIISRIGAEDVLIEYRTLTSEDGMSPLREILSDGDIRPVPPEIQASEFMLREEVDAWDNDGWWKGKIVKRWMKAQLYRVDFPLTGDASTYKSPFLRAHSDWVDGNRISSSNRS